jgi:hypothetical protein
MKRNQKRQFPTREEALEYLRERGELQYHGREGHNFEFCVYTYTLESGKKFMLFVHDSGLVEVRYEMN